MLDACNFSSGSEVMCKTIKFSLFCKLSKTGNRSLEVKGIMHIQLEEKLEWLLTEDAFNIYQQCMYTHTYEAYRNKVNDYISDKNTKIYICRVEDNIAGIIVLTLTGDESAELMGIAVHSGFRKQGIGSFLVRESANKMCIHWITAETDDDAVGFYEKMGFDISREVKYYGGKGVVRYHCSLDL